MPTIELTDDEARVLHEALTSWLGDLRSEIADTEARDFRESLKRTETVITALLRRLPQP